MVPRILCSTRENRNIFVAGRSAQHPPRSDLWQSEPWSVAGMAVVFRCLPIGCTHNHGISGTPGYFSVKTEAPGFTGLSQTGNFFEKRNSSRRSAVKISGLVPG